MAELTIGLDFGTHQTKVCIEDATDRRNISYSFFEFEKPDGGKSFFLPSIVQINNDDTLSYGYCDESKARVLGTEHAYKEPELVLESEPTYDPIPREPQRKPYPTVEQFIDEIKKGPKVFVKVKKGEKYTVRKQGKAIEVIANKDMNVLADIRKYASEHLEEFAEKQEREYSQKHLEWSTKKNIIEYRNSRLKTAWENRCDKARAEYFELHDKWDKHYREIRAVYRYFKIATFSPRYNWTQIIGPKTVSAWYLTYLLFKLYEKVDELSPVQMGIPQSIGDKSFSDKQVSDAEDIFYQALVLYRHYGTINKYCSAKVDELLSLTTFEKYEPDYDNDPGLLVLPEAFASLVTITKEGKISQGMTLLLDIGGGSTDISLFNVIQKRDTEFLPNISHIISYHHGLNHVFRMYADDHIGMTIEEISNLFRTNPALFEDYVNAFEHDVVMRVDKEIYTPMMEAAANCGADVRQFAIDLSKRPVIFTGGGGVYGVFHKKIHIFNEPLSVSSDLLSLKSITNKNVSDDELSILSVAYGLSIPQMREPTMTPLKELFAHIHIIPEEKKQGYEHGISDFS